MKRFFKKLILDILQVIRIVIPDKLKLILLDLMYQIFGIHPLKYAYNKIGVLNYEDNIVSGEKNVIENILPKYFDKFSDDLIMFDVGANLGKYSQLLTEHFSKSKIYAFEPVPDTFDILNKTTKNNNIFCYNLALGSKKENKSITTYSDNITSSHASLNKGIFEHFHVKKETQEIYIQVDTLKNFCDENNIEKIDFLKIDTEGNEYEVLIGAGKLLESNKIKIIQFEFGECTAIAKVFLKDFYDLLKDYNFYRVNTSNLIHLGFYNPINEIFRFQNILAINKSIDKC